MANSRLNLDWSLEFKDERNAFVQEYLKRLTFTPNDDEIEMMGKYILWGKTRGTNLNGSQEGLDLEPAHKTWSTEPVESLDALLESPNFSESILKKKGTPAYKTPKTTFSRSQARKGASKPALEALETLWNEIDRLEAKLSLYETRIGKRTKPLRPELEKRLGQAGLEAAAKEAAALGQWSYLKLKHRLVELRREQYGIRDAFAPTLMLRPTFETFGEETLWWDTDIEVKPLGLYGTLGGKIWRKDRMPEPQDFIEEELKVLSVELWRRAASKPMMFDFGDVRDLEKLDAVFREAKDLVNSDAFNEMESNLDKLVETYEVYCALAPLKDFHRDILKWKRAGATNQDTVDKLKEKYGVKYTVNYISTLYHKTILKTIAETALVHREVCENLMFPENFKLCIDCGRNLLRNEKNFMRKARSKDGFDCRCKACAKAKRLKYDGK